MDSEEFTRWGAYLSIEPPMEQRADYLAGAIGALIARVEGTMGGKPPRIKSRLIEFDARPEDDQKAFAAWIGALGKSCSPKSQRSS